jgi:hypothetical protein
MNIKPISKRWIIIAVCLGLVILRMFMPALPIDAYTVWLVAIAALFFILPDLRTLAPYFKRIKIGEYAEFELQELRKLESEIERAQSALPERPAAAYAGSVTDEVDQVLQESGKNPRAALLLLSARIEEQIRKRLQEAGLSIKYPLDRSVQAGIEAGLFPQAFLPAFKDFWTVRNRVAHGVGFDVDDAYILSLISLGTQLLRITSVALPVEQRRAAVTDQG